MSDYVHYIVVQYGLLSRFSVEQRKDDVMWRPARHAGDKERAISRSLKGETLNERIGDGLVELEP